VVDGVRAMSRRPSPVAVVLSITMFRSARRPSATTSKCLRSPRPVRDARVHRDKAPSTLSKRLSIPSAFIDPVQRLSTPSAFIDPSKRLSTPSKRLSTLSKRLSTPSKRLSTPSKRLSTPSKRCAMTETCSHLKSQQFHLRRLRLRPRLPHGAPSSGRPLAPSVPPRNDEHFDHTDVRHAEPSSPQTREV
jgi:hypothetical protein